MSNKQAKFCGLVCKSLSTCVKSLAVVVGAAASTAAFAQPTLFYVDNNPTPGEFAAGDSFSLDLFLDVGIDDIPAEMNVVGVTFDLELTAPVSSPGLEITSIDRAGSPFTFVTFLGPFPLTLDPTAGVDLGSGDIGLGVAPGGDIFIGTYSFAISEEAAAGEYVLGLAPPLPGQQNNNVLAVSDISFNGSTVVLADEAFTFTVIPEPATAVMLVGAVVGLAVRRRR